MRWLTRPAPTPQPPAPEVTRKPLREVRCPHCEVGAFTDDDNCWNCGRPWEPGNVSRLAALNDSDRNGPPNTHHERQAVHAWQVHEQNPTLERHTA